MSHGASHSVVVTRLAALVLTICTALSTSASAQAVDPPCASIPNHLNPVYIAGTISGNAMLQEVAVRMATTNPPATFVFQQTDSCSATLAVTATGACGSTDGGTTQCMTGTGTYYTADTTQSNVINANACTLPAGGVHANVAMSDVFPSSCDGNFTPSQATDYLGPVHGLVFVQPLNSVLCGHGYIGCNISQLEGNGPDAGPDNVCCPTCETCAGAMVSDCKSSSEVPRGISAEQAYFVLGFPEGGGVTPWNDPTQVFLPGAASAEQNILSAFLGIPAAMMLGNDETSSGGDPGVLAGLSASAEAFAGSSLGLVTTDFYDTDRGINGGHHLAALAYRAPGQLRAYYPDANSYPNTTGFPSLTINTFEKKSLRDGHYVLWGYLHVLVRNANTPAAMAANQFGSFLEGQKLGSDGYTAAQGAVASHLVPLCAMTVQRSTEGGELSSYSDPNPCACYFQTAVSTNVSGCTPCSTSHPCTSGTCNYGYCEE